MANFFGGFAKGFLQSGADRMERQEKANEELTKRYNDFRFDDEINRRRLEYEYEIKRREKQEEEERLQKAISARFGNEVSRAKSAEPLTTIGELPDVEDLPIDYQDPTVFTGGSPSANNGVIPSTKGIQSKAYGSNINESEYTAPSFGYKMTPERQNLLSTARSMDDIESLEKEFRKQDFDQETEMTKRTVLPGKVEKAQRWMDANNQNVDAVDYFEGVSEDEYLKERERVLKVHDDPESVNAKLARGGFIAQIDAAIEIAKNNPDKFGGLTMSAIFPEIAARFDDDVADYLVLQRVLGLGGKKTLGYTGPMSDYENKFFQELYASMKKGAKANINQLKMLKEIALRKDAIETARRDYLANGIPDPSKIDALIAEYGEAVPYQVYDDKGNPVELSVTDPSVPDFSEWFRLPEDQRPSWKDYAVKKPQLEDTNTETSYGISVGEERKGYVYTGGNPADKNNWEKKEQDKPGRGR